jgi:tetratricopeptide (TPR) repeat protein
MLYFRIKNYRFALPQFAHTVKINPKYPDAKLYLAICQEFTGDFASAILTYEQIIAENPTDYRASGGLYRTKRKQDYGAFIPDNYGTSTDTSSLSQYDIPRKNVDTTFRPLQPKSRLNLKPDSSRKN